MVAYIAWLYNGSVAYGTGIHIPLILIAICFTLYVIIPYTVVDLFGSYCLMSISFVQFY